METLKYIIDSHNNFQIFSHTTIHSVAARSMQSYPIAAGFITINITLGSEPIINCFGESVTLKLKSRGQEDANIIFNKLFLDCNT